MLSNENFLHRSSVRSLLRVRCWLGLRWASHVTRDVSCRHGFFFFWVLARRVLVGWAGLLFFFFFKPNFSDPTKDTRAVSYSDFVNKELVLFSNLDNERSIPSVVDGFKPGQRKVGGVFFFFFFCVGGGGGGEKKRIWLFFIQKKWLFLKPNKTFKAFKSCSSFKSNVWISFLQPVATL